KDGNYYIPPDRLGKLEQDRQVAFKYATSIGEITDDANPNGSLANIAGVCNAAGNVLGLMPHPERASEQELGSRDGRKIFESLVNYLKDKG
ncbi:MAG: phosphoribosylformylglycinamidine synthase subunit PurQ, partial [candidate division Zixibacteria bacterium]|nr:phosphoribosylformylglycinamidine synthase subunit PurQ [candidate division Zixibacteria bacterium]